MTRNQLRDAFHAGINGKRRFYSQINMLTPRMTSQYAAVEDTDGTFKVLIKTEQKGRSDFVEKEAGLTMDEAQKLIRNLDNLIKPQNSQTTRLRARKRR